MIASWIDSNSVAIIITVHTVHRINDYKKSLRRRPKETSNNAVVTREVFDGLPRSVLSIPLFIDNYNYFMNGVDVLDQFRQARDAHFTCRRTWFPIFMFILDIAVLNSIIVSKKLRHHGTPCKKKTMDIRYTLFHNLILEGKKRKDYEDIEGFANEEHEDTSLRPS